MIDRGLRFIIGIFLIITMLTVIVALFGDVQAMSNPKIESVNITTNNSVENVTAEISVSQSIPFEAQVTVDVSCIAIIILLVTIIEIGGICCGEGQYTQEELWREDDDE
jgi:hypothetical protein